MKLPQYGVKPFFTDYDGGKRTQGVHMGGSVQGDFLRILRNAGVLILTLSQHNTRGDLVRV